MTVPALGLTQFTVAEPAPGYWRATFDHPPTNLMNAVTAAELRAIVEAAEEAGDLRVLVLDSASAEYFFARYELSAGPLPLTPVPQGCRASSTRRSGSASSRRSPSRRSGAALEAAATSSPSPAICATPHLRQPSSDSRRLDPLSLPPAVAWSAWCRWSAAAGPSRSP
jgi:enoyl-CoA hydratase/carnithine racemase